MDSLLSFPVGLFHPLQHAGLSRRSPDCRPSTQSRPQTLRIFECYTAVVASPDKSNGYEEIASIFIPGRGRDHGGIEPRLCRIGPRSCRMVQPSWI